MSARGVAVVVASLALAAPAHADDPVEQARALFDAGLEDMQAGRLETGCPALAESLRLDPHPGTLFTLAECEAKRGRLATASARYGEFLDRCARLPADKRARQAEREAVARRQLDKLAPLVPRLVVHVDARAPAGTTVRRDGELLGRDALDSELLVDPGEHVLVVTTPGRADRVRRVWLEPGEHRDVDVGAAGEVRAGDRGDATDGRRVAAIALTAVGAAGVVVGAVSGALMLGKRSTIDAGCRASGVEGTSLCTPEGAAAGDSAKQLGAAASVGLLAGAAALGVGVVLFATEPRRAGPTRGRHAALRVAFGADGLVTAAGAF